MSVAIIGTGSDLPGRAVDNNELARLAEDFDADRAGCTLDTWVHERIGVRTRHRVAPGEGTAAMAIRAGHRALAMAGVAPSEIDLLVLSTFTSDHRLPQSVAIVQAELGMTAKCVQLEAACTGFADGVLVADALMQSLGYETALVIHSETMSAVMDPRQFLLSSIFGDGAGAAVLRDDPTGRTGLLAQVTGTDGSKAFWLEAGGGTLSAPTAETLASGRHFMQFKYKAIFDFAVDRMSDSCRQVVRDAGHDLADVDYIVAHQTGVNILKAVAEQLDVPEERFLVTLDHTGNTSGATIPIALDEFTRNGVLQEGMRVLMPTVGAGMAWCALYVNWAACGVPRTKTSVRSSSEPVIDLTAGYHNPGSPGHPRSTPSVPIDTATPFEVPA